MNYTKKMKWYITKNSNICEHKKRKRKRLKTSKESAISKSKNSKRESQIFKNRIKAVESWACCLHADIEAGYV